MLKHGPDFRQSVPTSGQSRDKSRDIVGTKSGQCRDSRDNVGIVGTKSGQCRDMSGHSENHNYVAWNGCEHQKTIRPMHTIIEVTVFVLSLCYPCRNLLHQSTTKKRLFVIHFSSCLVRESCLSAPTLPKTCRKKNQIFFLDPHWNSLGACNFLWGLMVIEELQAKSRPGGGERRRSPPVSHRIKLVL